MSGLLKTYYLQEFKEKDHSKKIPNQIGVYTDPSDGLWYDLKNASSSLTALQKDTLNDILEAIFQK